MKKSFVAFGKNAVKNIIESNFFINKKVIIRNDKLKEYKEIVFRLNKKNIPYEVMSENDFSRHIPDKKHQGIILFIKEYKYTDIYSLIKGNEKNNSLIVMLDSIEDPHNFGAIIRTCSAMNVDGIIIPKKNQIHVNNTVIKVSTGGISYVPICIVEKLENAIDVLKENNYSIISTVCEEKSLFYNDINAPSFACVIFGNEHDGIKKRIIKKSDLLISIPLENNMNSLNVSVCCGIIISSIKQKIKS